MIVLDLKFVVALGLLLLTMAALLAVSLDRRVRRSPLAIWNANETDLQALAETAPFGLVVINENSECIFSNALARQFLEVSIGKLPETPWREPFDRDLASARVPQNDSAPYRVVTLSPDQTVSWWICPCGEVTLVILSDLTRVHKLEKTTQNFLSELSHELRTPLTAILAHLEILRMGDIPETVRQNSLRLAHTEIVRIANLVQGLLSLSRLELATDLRLKPVNVVVVVEAAITELLPAFDAKPLDFSLEADTSLPLVLGDEERLKQVFLNILDNTTKYCRSGDRVTVAIKRHPHGVQVKVCDTGPGVPAEHLPHITKRLYQADSDSPGSGLGLALVDEILNRHHSQLTIRSETEGEHTGMELEFVLQAV